MGIFIQQFQMSCPYDSGQRRKVSYFYRHINGKPPADPASVRDIIDVHVGRIQRWGVYTRGDNTTSTTVINTPATARVAPQNNTNVDDSTRTVADITPCRHNDDDNVLVDRGEGEVCSSDVDSNVSIYWESSEAAKLFGFSYNFMKWLPYYCQRWRVLGKKSSVNLYKSFLSIAATAGKNRTKL